MSSIITLNGNVVTVSGSALTTESGEGGGGVQEKLVNFIDYDGTLLYSYDATEFANLTNLPANPTHSRLTAQGWNWTLAQITAQLTAMPNQKVWVGQMYTTVSGATEIDITLDDSRYLSPALHCSPNGTVIIDWGDGSNTNTVTGTSLSTRKFTTHNYATTGNYTIKITVSSGTVGLYGGNSVMGLMVISSSYARTRVYSRCVNHVYIGQNTKISPYAFTNCFNLSEITIPTGAGQDNSGIGYGTYVFNYCYNLKCVVIPKDITKIEDAPFYQCSGLNKVSLPASITRILSSAFYNCYDLAAITIPHGVTEIGNNAFSTNLSLTSLIMPSTITNYGTSVFSSCYGLKAITLTGNVTTIGDYFFSNCYLLENAVLPSSLTSLGRNTFYSCYYLPAITIPSTVTSIGQYAINGAWSLTNLTKPSAVTSIAAIAFGNCYSLGEIHFKPTTQPTVDNSDAFSNLPTDCIICVPSGKLSAYTSATNYPSSSTYTYIEE